MITGPIDIAWPLILYVCHFDLSKKKKEEIYGQIIIESCNNGLDKVLNPPHNLKKTRKEAKN